MFRIHICRTIFFLFSLSLYVELPNDRSIFTSRDGWVDELINED